MMYVCRAILFLIHMATDAVALSIDCISFRVSNLVSRMSRSGNVSDSLKALVFFAISISSRGRSWGAFRAKVKIPFFAEAEAGASGRLSS